MNYISDIIPEEGIVKYITDYASDREPEMIFKTLADNLTIKIFIECNSMIYYNFKYDNYTLETFTPYISLNIFSTLLDNQLLYDFLYTWNGIRTEKDLRNIDDESLKIYNFFSDIFDEEFNLTETEKNKIGDHIIFYFF